MSVKAIGWAFEQEGLSPRNKLTLVALADNANDEGVCWPGWESVARKTGLSRASVYRCYRDLEGADLLAEVKVDDRLVKRLALSQRETGTSQPETADSQPEKRTNKGTVKNRQEPEDRVRKEVNRKAVSEAEYTLAAAVVSSFNEIAGTALRVDPHLTPIVGRIRERPELNGNHHRQIIEAVFAGDHWWKGAPGPRIIYGNAAQFEQSIELARAAAKKKAEPKFDVNAEMRRIRKEQGLED